MLLDLPGVLCHIDNIIIYKKMLLNMSLDCIQSAGITLNEGKFQFYQSCVTILSHVIHENEI